MTLVEAQNEYVYMISVVGHLDIGSAMSWEGIVAKILD